MATLRIAPTALTATEGLNLAGTLNLPQRDYSDEQYGAMAAVVKFREYPERTRIGIVRALASAARVQRTSPFLSRDAFLMRQLGQLRLMAYGPATDDWGITHNPGILSYPWALTNKEFARAYMYVRTGQLPDDKDFGGGELFDGTKKILWDKAVDLSNEKMTEALEAFLAAYGGKVIGGILRVSKLGYVALAIDLSKQIIEAKLDAAAIDAAKASYERERVRRRIAYV